MDMTFEKQGFGKRLKSMLKVDFRRMFTMPLVYIMAGVCLVMPILILVMTSMMGGSTVDPNTGAESTMEGFTNVWQIIGSVSSSQSSQDAQAAMDMTSMCNINLLYFLAAVLVCIFVADDFRSGYAKNLFTVRSKRIDYVFSKTLVCFVGGVIMLLAFFIGAMLGGAIAGLPFTMQGFGIGGLIACVFSKIFVMAVFVSIDLVLSIVAKQKLWLSLLCCFAGGMLLFMMIPMMTPLNASIINVIMCLAGGAMFSVGLGALSNLVLQKTSLV